MAASKPTPNSVDEYLEEFPEDVQQALKKVRATVRKAAPKAEEAIKYGMPTLVFHGNMLSFGAWKKHIGMYPVPAGDAAFTKAISKYKHGRSTARFPLDEPLPLKLITEMVKLLVKRSKQKQMKAKKTGGGKNK